MSASRNDPPASAELAEMLGPGGPPPRTLRPRATRDFELVDVGCPDCRGVLGARSVGTGDGHLVFICRIGHSFSAESLVPIKEDQLENALWTAVELVNELVLLHEELAGRAQQSGDTLALARLEARLRRARSTVHALRELIALEGPAGLDPLEGERSADG